MVENMKIENKALNMQALAEKWDVSGAVSIYHKSECVYKDFFGLANREKKEPITESSTYLFTGETETLLALSMLLLEDMKKLKITDTIDKYIPEYIHSSKITIKHILLGLSGMRDYYYGYILPKLASNSKHNELDDYSRYINEVTLSTDNYSFNNILKLIENDELEYEPGSIEEESDFSSTDKIFCREIIERVSGMKLIDFEMKYIFEPLNMNSTKPSKSSNTLNYYLYRERELLYVPVSETADNLFVTNLDDMEKLMLAVNTGKILSAKAWKKAFTFTKEGIGLGFGLANGTICTSNINLLGYTVIFYFNKEFNVCYMHITNSGLIFKSIERKTLYFRKELRELIDTYYIYPKNTKIVPYGKSNWYNTFDLDITEEQREFVDDTKLSIAHALAYQNDFKLFVEMEGNRPVGLIVLQINKKAGKYYFDSLLVDKRYQGRGYGKIMLKWGIDYFKKLGAKKLTIGVNRHNTAAQKLYKSVGFIEDFVYEEEIDLKLEL